MILTSLDSTEKNISELPLPTDVHLHRERGQEDCNEVEQEVIGGFTRKGSAMAVQVYGVYKARLTRSRTGRLVMSARHGRAEGTAGRGCNKVV
jgi:hypothetical protein